MANFCTNCGSKIRKEDKFCTNCGSKIRKEDKFCTNCGTKLREEDKFCTNCGTENDKSDIKPDKHLFNSEHGSLEKIYRIAKEKEKKKKLKIIDEIFESEEIRLEIIKNNINQINVISIKDNLKTKLIDEKEKMSEEEIKYFIKTELKKAKKEQKEISKKIEKNEPVHGGYCNLNCRHCYEEFMDSGGGIVGDFDSEGYVEYYCGLGHSLSYGSFCKDYE